MMTKKKQVHKKTNIEKKIEELEAQILEIENKLEEADKAKLRALADLNNYQRRATQERIKWSEIAVSNFIKSFLPRFLELQLGILNTKDKDAKKVVSQFFNQLKKEGLEKIEPKKGDILDTNFHEVLMTGEGKKGTIVQTLEAGWKYKDMIISPAKVSAVAE